MKYGELVTELSGYPFFDWPTVLQMFGRKQARADLRMQLSRWVKQGRLISLRRGMYAWPEQYAKHPLNPAEVAHALYRPSYLSGLWALGYYGMIPEQVVVYTSVTTRATKKFDNILGNFEYRHVKNQAFYGYRQIQIMGRDVFIADPEKALLDVWHLNRGVWTDVRMEAMRFQAFDVIDVDKLLEYAKRYVSPRLMVAVDIWCHLAKHEAVGSEVI